MHPIQERLLELSKTENLAKMSLREMAAAIGDDQESPQKIKHHLQQLEKKGFLTINRHAGTMKRALTKPGLARGLTNQDLFSIPIVGAANCGPANIFAEQNIQGFLKVSGNLLERSSPTGLYAIRASGSSMNRVEIGKARKRIEDGDYVIVDSKALSPRDNDVVVAVIDDKATIKRFIDDRKNGQIVLKADSSQDYDPIYLHPEDDFSINGKVIGVIKSPSANR